MLSNVSLHFPAGYLSPVLSRMFHVTSILSLLSFPDRDVLATSSTPSSPLDRLKGAGVGVKLVVPHGTRDADVGSAGRPVPQPSQGQRLGSLERPPLVPTTLINCHLRRPRDQLFPCRPGQADSGRGVEPPALLLLAGNLCPSSLAGETSQRGVRSASEKPAVGLLRGVAPRDPGEVTRRCMSEGGWN